MTLQVGFTAGAGERGPAIVDRALGDWHFVVAVDVHGNRSAW